MSEPRQAYPSDFPPYLAKWMALLDEGGDMTSFSSVSLAQNLADVPILDTLDNSKSNQNDSAFSQSHERNIRQDVARTFTDICFFSCQSCKGNALLESVLIKLSLEFPEIGYCQGMNYLAGYFLYCVKDYEPEDAENFVLALLRGLFTSQKHDLQANFQPGMLQTQIRVFQFESLFRTTLPDLYYYFEEQDVSSEFFVLTFFLPLFTNKFPFSFLEAFFTVFIENGWSAAFSTLLFVLNYFKEDLLKLKLEDLSKFFSRSNPKLAEISVSDEFTSVFPVSDEQLSYLEAQCISMKLGIDSNDSNSPIRDSDLHFFAEEEGLSVEKIQTKISSFNLLTKFDSVSLQEKIEFAEKDVKTYEKTFKKLKRKVLKLSIGLEDHLQARSAVVHQLSCLKEERKCFKSDITVLTEKLFWLNEEIGEKQGLMKKLTTQLSSLCLLLDESVEKKECFSKQLFDIVSKAELRKQEEIKGLRYLV